MKVKLSSSAASHAMKQLVTQDAKIAELKKERDALRAELAQIKASSVEVEYVDSGAFQGGEEDCSMKGLTRAKTWFVYSPDAKPWTDDEI